MQRPSIVALALLIPAFAAAQETADLAMLTRIRNEAVAHSQVMETLFQLTDVIGPRLTVSPQMKKANEWTRDQLTTWGMANSHLESWGPFGQAWSVEHASVHLVSPSVAPLIALPRAWAPGTNGTVRGKAVLIKVEEEADLAKYKGTLAGKIVLMGEAKEIGDGSKPLSTRYSSKELDDLAQLELKPEVSRRERGIKMFRLRKALDAFLGEEGALVAISPSPVESAIFVAAGGMPEKGKGARVPSLVMQVEHYNRLARLVAKDMPVDFEVDVRVHTSDDDPMGYNTVAEIPGSDPKGEIVMLGAHLDSWHGGTGATDNGTGSAVVLEAMRILKALDVKPRRTIRIALWSGEEQGLLGSRAYVAEHFGSRARSADPKDADLPLGLRQFEGPITLKPDQARLSVYFNLDNGAGRIRGIYSQGNAAAGPLFSAWLAPLADLGAGAVTQRSTGRTDIEGFDEIGLPAFEFIQDPLDYESRTHHTNQDVYDRVQREDMVQASIVMASFVWDAAMRDRPFPRKPMSK